MNQCSPLHPVLISAYHAATKKRHWQNVKGMYPSQIHPPLTAKFYIARSPRRFHYNKRRLSSVKPDGVAFCVADSTLLSLQWALRNSGTYRGKVVISQRVTAF